MNLKTLIQDDDAVSPVIGVILMVAITVILAAVIATFVLGLGDSVSNNAPQASFDFNPGSDEVLMTGGDELNGDNIKITKGDNDYVYEADDGSNSPNVPGTITAGTNLTENAAAGNGFAESDTLRIIWTNPDGENTAVIGSYNA